MGLTRASGLLRSTSIARTQILVLATDFLVVYYSHPTTIVFHLSGTMAASRTSRALQLAEGIEGAYVWRVPPPTKGSSPTIWNFSLTESFLG